MKILSIAGARPNFMKLASLVNAVMDYNIIRRADLSAGFLPWEQAGIQHMIVHTGQHYDEKMSKSFFSDLRIPRPDINLEVGSGSHAQQTAEIMKRFEPVLLAEKPDVLLVVGDVNSTIACTLVASKIMYDSESPCGLFRPIIGHVEAGLRSFDRNMPEEINRILTDALSDLLFITEESGHINLIKEGVEARKIYFVGNVMIDTLQYNLEQAHKSAIREKLGIDRSFALVTLHRPSNVDSQKTLASLVECMKTLSDNVLLVFPIHPRTRNNLSRFSLLDALETNQNIQVVEPLGYLDFLKLIMDAQVVVTDSGGIQEETTVLNVPCVTLRNNTERPITTIQGSNYLVGIDPKKIIDTVLSILQGKRKQSQIPELWDGNAGKRVIAVVVNTLMDVGKNEYVGGHLGNKLIHQNGGSTSLIRDTSFVRCRLRL